MRELKFRLWSKRTNRYITTCIVDGVEYNEISALDLFGLRSDAQFQSDVIIEQYTGLKDKKGKEIYEGDIVRYGSDNYEVKFDEMKDSDCTYYYLGWAMGDLSLYELNSAVEIIGNIHENPELLGGEK